MGGESFRPRNPEEENSNPIIPASPEQIKEVALNHKKAGEIKRQNDFFLKKWQDHIEKGMDKFLDLPLYAFGDFDAFSSIIELPEDTLPQIKEPMKTQAEIKPPHIEKDLKPKEQAPIKEKKEKLKGITESSELQKEVIEKGILANLAYSEFVKISETGKHRVIGVTLDPLGFPSLDKIFGADSPDFNSDEKFLNAYVNNGDNKRNIDRSIQITDDVAEIMRIAGFYKQDVKSNLANISDSYRPSLTDTPNPLYSELPEYKDLLLANGIEALKKEKIVENGIALEKAEKKYDIIDYFPNDGDIKGIKTKNEALSKKPHSKGDLIEHANLTSFGAVCVVDKDTKERTIAIRGTRLSSWGDLTADLKLLLKQIPQDQVLDMITFVNRNLDPEGKQISITGHSLGGALAQILTAMYTSQKFDPTHREQGTLVKKAFVYNSPGAKGLSSSLDKTKFPPEIIAKFDDFVYNDTNNVVGELITSIRGMRGPSLISDLNKPMANNEIQLKELVSHSVVKLIEYVRELKDLRELDIIRIRDFRYTDKTEQDKTK